MKAYKFRLLPDVEQRILLAKTFGCVRFIYNKMLKEIDDNYAETSKHLRLTPAKYKKDYEWLTEVDSLALCNAQRNLETSFRNFFRNPGHFKHPVFKSRKQNYNSYTTNRIKNNIDLNDNAIKLPKLGWVKLIKHRLPPETNILKSVTVSKSPAGKYYASILYDVTITATSKVPESAIGLDFTMKKLCMDSNGNSSEYPGYYKANEEKLKRYQRALSRRRKGSGRYLKQKHKVAVLHEKIKNQRKDFLHKLSDSITKNYDMVCIEDLDMKQMSSTLNLGKHLHDNGWGIFVTLLSYKASERGVAVVKVNKWFPSSKRCSLCGVVKETLLLSERVYSCDCGNIMDRDINAAINIREEGLFSYMTAGHAVSAQLCCALKSTRLRSPHLKASA